MYYTDINITPALAVVKNKLNWLSILVNDYQVSEDIAQQFIDHRKNKKAPMSKIVLDNLIAQSKIIGINLEAAIKEMIINNWVGFKAEWIKNQTSKNNFNKIEKNNSDLKSQNYPNDVCKF